MWGYPRKSAESDTNNQKRAVGIQLVSQLQRLDDNRADSTQVTVWDFSLSAIAA